LGGDWSRFGYNAARSDAGPERTGITAENVRRLVLRRVDLDGTVDSSPVYLRAALVLGRRRGVFIVTTTYGKVVAVDANSGRSLWQFVPPHLASWEGTYRITTSSPVVDPGGQFVYSAAPDGFVYKLRVETGLPVHSASWPALITKNPSSEKISSPLNIAGNFVLAATASFDDGGNYQGHVVVIDRRSGRLVRVWNALCGLTRSLLSPNSCKWAGAGIWARAGVVVQPRTHDLIVATGNGVWDGHSAWSNSVVILSPNASRVVGSWTPADWLKLAAQDLDVGSTAPALLTDSLVAQGGKDGRLRLLDLRLLERKPRARIIGQELQTVTPGGGLYATPAVWRNKHTTWLFVTSTSAITGYSLARDRLVLRWQEPVPGPTLGTSPVVAGGLLYMNDVGASALDVYQPATGKLLARLPADPGHWSSPIVTDGRIALGEGDANAQGTTGVLEIYSLRRSG
jgi:outer membrane protein assembly factor BamB